MVGSFYKALHECGVGVGVDAWRMPGEYRMDDGRMSWLIGPGIHRAFQAIQAVHAVNQGLKAHF